MTRMVTTLWAGVIAFGMAGEVFACAAVFQGQAVQGGLIVGRTTPGARVEIAERSVRVSPDGLFLAGFGRDAPTTLVLSITEKGKPVRPCEIAVKARTYKVTRIDGLAKSKVTPRKPAHLKRIRADNAAIGKVRGLETAHTDFAGGFIWPLKGRLSGVYGSQRILNGKPRRPHNGVDIAAPKGSPIRATGPGIIALVHEDMFLSGKTVMIDHGHGLSSVYIHMSAITVRQGQKVAQGDQIGRVGMTGRTTGPHLHWGMSLFKTALDPALLAGPRG